MFRDKDYLSITASGCAFIFLYGLDGNMALLL